MSLDPNVPPDPLATPGAPERVHYATGVLLDASDFRDEQTYHRSRLATALRNFAGFGTLAGLRVIAPEQDDGELELRVAPGVALDRFGRLVELRDAQCIRLARWFDGQETALLRSIVRREPRVAAIVDVFLAAGTCARGKTPAFATGPFDALDALIPARLAETPDLTLVPRAEGGADAPPTPRNFWPGAEASAEERLQAVLASWDPGTADRADRALDPLAEHVEGHDLSAVLLARVSIPVTLAADAPAGTRPQLLLTERVSVDNSLRPFIFLPGKWLGGAFVAEPLITP
jgi:hypothetical protein